MADATRRDPREEFFAGRISSVCCEVVWLIENVAKKRHETEQRGQTLVVSLDVNDGSTVDGEGREEGSDDHGVRVVELFFQRQTRQSLSLTSPFVGLIRIGSLCC